MARAMWVHCETESPVGIDVLWVEMYSNTNVGSESTTFLICVGKSVILICGNDNRPDDADTVSLNCCINFKLGKRPSLPEVTKTPTCGTNRPTFRCGTSGTVSLDFLAVVVLVFDPVVWYVNPISNRGNSNGRPAPVSSICRILLRK